MHGILGDADLGEDAEQVVAEMAIRIKETIEGHKIRDWADNPDVQNRIKRDIEDYIYSVMDERGVALVGSEMDLLIDNLVDVARKRANL